MLHIHAEITPDLAQLFPRASLFGDKKAGDNFISAGLADGTKKLVTRVITGAGIANFPMHVGPVVGADGDRPFQPGEECMFVFVDIDFLSFAIQTEGLVAGLDKIHF